MIKATNKQKRGFIAVSLLVVVGCLCGLIFAAPKRIDILNIGQGRFIVLFDDWYEIDSCLRVFQVRENFFQVRNGCVDLFERLKTGNPELQMPDYWQQ